MTKKLILAVSFLTFSLAGFAQEITPIEGANIKCSQHGGAVSINTSSKRLWQNDTVEEETGLELIVEKFAVARCPNCYTITGKFQGMGPGQSIVYSVVGNMRDFKKATLSVSFNEAGSSKPVAKMKCKLK